MQASQNSSQPILNLIRSAPMTSIHPCTKPLNLSPLSSIKYTLNYSKWCHIVRWIMQFGWICMQYLWTRINTSCQRLMQRIKGWLPFIIFACQTHIKKFRRELTKLQKHNQTSWSCFFFLSKHNYIYRMWKTWHWYHSVRLSLVLLNYGKETTTNSRPRDHKDWYALMTGIPTHLQH